MNTKKNHKTIKKSETQEILDQISSSREFRKKLANSNMFWFFSVYFAHYIEYKSAKFQKEIFSLVSGDNQIVAITAFRNSAKSTICSLILPIWGIVGKWKKKFVVIVCQNQSRAKDTLSNIRMELETIGIFVQDYQPRAGKTDKWSEDTIILPKYKAKVSVISIGEAIRGMRHLQFRPDLIICDDLEDVPSCQNYESRKKLWQFINGELIPAGDRNTKYVFIGNKVHNDSAMMKLKKAIKSKVMKGVYREYPLINHKGVIAWPGKYPNIRAIDRLKATYASEIDYQREQMLKILPEGDAIIKPEDINYYDELPNLEPEFFIISVDPAFSQENWADKTAIITAAVFKIRKTWKIYIYPNPINQKLTVTQMSEKIKAIINSFNGRPVVRIFVEGGSSQIGLIQMLQSDNISAEGVPIKGRDKKARLHISSPWIKKGQILFPYSGSQELVNQTLYFGTERYDDLVDALTLMVLALLDIINNPTSESRFIKMDQSIQESICINSAPGLYDLGGQKEDWGDGDDKQMFKKLKMRNPRRIYR